MSQKCFTEGSEENEDLIWLHREHLCSFRFLSVNPFNLHEAYRGGVGRGRGAGRGRGVGVGLGVAVGVGVALGVTLGVRSRQRLLLLRRRWPRARSRTRSGSHSGCSSRCWRWAGLRALPPANVQVTPIRSSPDDHFAASPDGRVIPTAIRRLSGLRSSPRIICACWGSRAGNFRKGIGNLP